MKIIDIVNGPWAITPTMLQEIQRIYASHLHRSEKIDIAAIEAATGKSLSGSRAGAYVIDGVCVIPVQGVIGKKMNLMTNISGGCSTEAVANDYLTALNDPAVKGVVLHVDSPGGTVDGTMALADVISANRGAKPVITCADGIMCSAAYWIGSAADSINIADLTTDVGSIGVVAAHMDISGWEEKQGVKTTEITAGQYKRAVSQYAPLSAEGRAMIQSDLDQIYGLFLDAVAANRGCAVDEVVANMAEGRVFLGQKAIDCGLVDSVATLSATIQQVKDLAAAKSVATQKRVSVTQPNKKQEVSKMTLEQFKADHPEICEALVAESSAGHAEALAVARAEGAAAENARIREVKGQSLPGHEALIEQLAFDGTSTAADAALAIVTAEKTLRGTVLQQMEAEAPPVVPAAEDEGDCRSCKRADFDKMTTNERQSFRAAGGKIVD